MMADIVKRLRNWEQVDIVDAHEDGALYNAAADEIERLREALKPFAEKFLFPDDTGYADELRAEEGWSEEANDSQVDDWLIERRWVRKARNAMEGK